MRSSAVRKKKRPTREIGGSGRRYTQEDRAIIFQGCPVSTLAEIFHMKRQNVERRLAECPVAGMSQTGTPLYHIADAAPYLMRVKLTEKQITKTLQNGDPRDFPAHMTKMFWDGQIQKKRFELEAGELWHTSEVSAVLSSAFNTIRMSLLLLPDELRDNAGLNSKQSKLVQDTIDAAMESCKDALVEPRKPNRQDSESEDDGEV